MKPAVKIGKALAKEIFPHMAVKVTGRYLDERANILSREKDFVLTTTCRKNALGPLMLKYTVQGLAGVPTVIDKHNVKLISAWGGVILNGMAFSLNDFVKDEIINPVLKSSGNKLSLTFAVTPVEE